MQDITIMVVDDESRMRKLIKDFLIKEDYKVIEAGDGEEALNIFNEKKEKIDLILLDVMMPKLDGWSVLRQIRQESKVPVIMLTAVNEDQKMISGLKIGADDYIVKPFILPNLLARIEAVLRRANRNKQVLKPENVTINQADNFNSLTKREKDVLLLVTQGESNKSIADKLVLSEVTVKSHLNSIFKKLSVTNRTQAVLVAMQMNLVENNK